MNILITGANRGIGLALAHELVHLGHHVIAGARHPAAATDLQAIRQQHSDALTITEIDVDSESSLESVSKLLREKHSSLDILVNNAAIFPEEGNESFRDIDLQFFRDAFETNVLGVLRTTRAFMPLLENASQPRIVNISSGAGSISDKTDSGYYAYSTSKAALNMVTRALAAELRGKKICVVAMSPGWVKTDMGGPNAPLTPEESASAIAKTITNLPFEQTAKFLERTGADYPDGW
jgi:NAD(P)-dependent dehydrogenase (short-subunit alcohol dehydrogenase family)